MMASKKRRMRKSSKSKRHYLLNNLNYMILFIILYNLLTPLYNKL